MKNFNILAKANEACATLSVKADATLEKWSMKETMLTTGLLLSLLVLMAVNTDIALASTSTSVSDNTFSSFTDQLTKWIEGSLGKGIAIAFVIVGIITGIARSSLMAIAIGMGAALGLSLTPTVIGNIFTATLLPLA